MCLGLTHINDLLSLPFNIRYFLVEALKRADHEIDSVRLHSSRRVLIQVANLCAGEEVVSAVGCEVDRLEKDIQKLVPGIRHVDIEAHNPNGPAPREKFYLY